MYIYKILTSNDPTIVYHVKQLLITKKSDFFDLSSSLIKNIGDNKTAQFQHIIETKIDQTDDGKYDLSKKHLAFEIVITNDDDIISNKLLIK